MNVRRTLRFAVLPGRLAICRLPAGSQPPDWAWTGSLHSITRAGDEVSVVCDERAAPEGTRCEKGWRCLALRGPFTLSEVGVLADLAPPLARAGVSIFVLSTFDTDWILVRESQLDAAAATLRAEGHVVEPVDC